MPYFHNIWGPEHHGPASACNECGAICYTMEEMFEHRCPGTKEEVILEVEITEVVKPKFPWMQLISMFLLIVLLLVLGVFFL